MGLADRDYARKRKVQWDASRGEMRLADGASSRPSSVSSFGWLAILVAMVVAGAGLWRYRTGGPPLPTVEVPSATVVQDAPGSAVAMVESENPVLVGRVTRVLDGDTIEVALSSGPVQVRFGSVDAPEKKQPWGREAREALTRKLGGREVVLDVVSQDQYDRLVAVVGLDDENVNAWLVRQGHAWVYRQYATDTSYCAWEVEARSGRSGLWALPAAQQHAPWEFRAVQRRRAGGFTDYSNETLAQCVAAMHKKPVPVAVERRPRLRCRTAAAARSRATSAAAARSITCLAVTRTVARRSTSRRVSGGSARKQRHARRGGGRRKGSAGPRVRVIADQ